jgi:hypothetical protein
MATLKNTTVDDTGSVYLPRGTTAQRPANPGNGAMRYNTTLGYVEFYWMGIWVNAETNRGGVPMSGLLFLIDVDNPASWNGSTLTDISGNNVSITTSGTLTEQTSAVGSKYLTGGSNDWINIPLDVATITGNNFSVMTLCGYNGGNRGRITSTSSGNNWLLGHWGAGDARYHPNAWVSQNTSSGGGAANNQWGVHVGTGRTNTGRINMNEWQYWKNGSRLTVNVNLSPAGANGPNNLSINRFGNGSEPSDWKWQYLAVWNRVLTEDEIMGLSGALLERGGF